MRTAIPARNSQVSERHLAKDFLQLNNTQNVQQATRVPGIMESLIHMGLFGMKTKVTKQVDRPHTRSLHHPQMRLPRFPTRSNQDTAKTGHCPKSQNSREPGS